MADTPKWLAPFAHTELGDLLAGTVQGVLRAQEELDAYTQKRRDEYQQAPEGSLALPPLSFLFKNVAIELELSATVGEVDAGRPAILCRTLNPASVGLYGYQASSGMKVRVLLGPDGVLPIKVEDKKEK